LIQSAPPTQLGVLPQPSSQSAGRADYRANLLIVNPSAAPPTVATGPSGSAAVAAGSKDTADAAGKILAAGGNAVDAAIGGMLAACVCEPVFASLGGGGFLMLRQPDGREVLVDFFANTPGLENPDGRPRPTLPSHGNRPGRPDGPGTADTGAQSNSVNEPNALDRRSGQIDPGTTPDNKTRDGLRSSAREPDFTPITVKFPGKNQVFHAGPGAVATPGLLAGILHTSARFGQLDLAEVVAPAISLGVNGAIVEPVHSTVLALVREIMSLTHECRDLITVAGRYATVGDRIHNPDLAQFLMMVGNGSVDSLTSPAFADPLLDLMAHTSGHVTRADLEYYRVAERSPLTVERAGARIALNPRPAFGGSIVADALGQLDSLGTDPNDWRDVVSALRLATEHNRARTRDLGLGGVSKGTTHISVVDFDGQVASITTSNGAGSGIVVPGTGIHLNNMLGEADLNPGGFHSLAAGLRMSSMMAPTIVETADGTVTGFGSGGSERIRSAILATVVRLVDLGQTAAAAIEAPRLHAEPDGVQLEPGWDPSLNTLLETDQTVNTWSSPDLFFGGVHAVSRMSDGSVSAVGDSRRGGAALVVKR
jgi:gamma-glutamyltranspeptidase/glutathione hydrolase